MKTFATICAAILMAFGSAQAQSSPYIKVHFSSPVVAGVTEIPAGDATIQVIDIGAGSVSLLVRSGAGPQTTVLVNRITRQANYDSPETSVELEHKGDALYLDQVWVSETQGYKLIR